MDRRTQFPADLTQFFGRKAELHTIRVLLGEPDCRLLTLTGPGGMGKTRLAIETAKNVQDFFSDGVCFIDLQAVQSGTFIPVAVMDALGISHGHEDALAHLMGYLADRQMLLVLDNFEQLVPWANTLSQLIAAAPRLKLLVTSRETLNLKEEWQFPVNGMDTPAGNAASDDEPGDPRSSSAVQLFAACARRVHPDFSIENELDPVIEICQSVEGMPLAIELAASWTRMLPCKIIAREIKENLRFLASSLRNIPERHRSILVVFEQTWRMLSPQEQQIFKALSAFRGGFTHAAARHVAQADLTVMLGLVDKSLLQRITTGGASAGEERFGVHELLRQFSQDLLVQDETEWRKVYDRHCDYFMNFLQMRNDGLSGAGQQAALQEIRAELENVRAAWNWAVQNKDVERLQHAVQPLDTFCQYQGRFTEGTALFEQALSTLENMPHSSAGAHTRAQLECCLGWFCIRLGNFDQAHTRFESSLSLYSSLQTPPPPGLGYDPTAGLVILAVLRGAHAEAVALGEGLLKACEASGVPLNIATAHYTLASAWLAQGRYETAREHAQKLSDIAAQLNDGWLLAYSLKLLGDIFYGLHDTQQARELYLKCYRLRGTLNDPEGMALAANHLGKVALLEKNFGEAQQFFEESRARYTTIYDRGGLSNALKGLGDAAIGLGRLNEAQQYLTHALRIAHEIHYIPLIASLFVSIAVWLINTGDRERGLDLLRFARSFPAGDQETRQLAEQTLSDYLPAETSDHPNAPDTTAPADLSSMTQKLLLEIEAITVVPAEVFPTELPEVTVHAEQPASALHSGKDALIETLTEREIEILKFMDDGHTNQSIGKQLFLSLGTIKWYTNQIYGKLQVKSRTQAVAKARKIGIL
jgi:predicted ATPase/DNA-binding CsgD family transcriptional regulator